MQTPEEIRRDLPPDLPQPEREALTAMAMRLQSLRSAPTPSFRGELRRKLLGAQPKERNRARHTRALATAYVTSGTFLLAIAGAGLAGAGPFAPA